MIGRFGINAVVWLNAGLLAAAAVAVQPVPVLLPPSAARPTFNHKGQDTRAHNTVAAADLSPRRSRCGIGPGQSRNARQLRYDPLG
jgi:hypothetical protein